MPTPYRIRFNYSFTHLSAIGVRCDIRSILKQTEACLNLELSTDYLTKAKELTLSNYLTIADEKEDEFKSFYKDTLTRRKMHAVLAELTDAK